MKTILKYTGSKSGLVDVIDQYVPDETQVIVEPFSGSVSYAMSTGLPFYITDAQPMLIHFWKALRDQPGLLIEHIKMHEEKSCKDYFHELTADHRAGNFESATDIELAAFYYYTVYAGFNGLFRVNKKDGCNTPWGGDSRKFILPEDRFLEVSKYLNEKCIGIYHQQFDDEDFLESILASGKKYFVLIDPPYVNGDDGKKVYREYTSDKIDDDFYSRIKLMMTTLSDHEIPFLLTNTYCDYILDKFASEGDWCADKVPVSYSIAADGQKRGSKFEAFVSKKGANNGNV